MFLFLDDKMKMIGKIPGHCFCEEKGSNALKCFSVIPKFSVSVYNSIYPSPSPENLNLGLGVLGSHHHVLYNCNFIFISSGTCVVFFFKYDLKVLF